ncbi:hypothetical protein PG985_014632 [Apiospora marii]|uniref:Uncharacterized protein n=1 Tax=Apiospora marii TaxID=335849 RepID=A0ABR1R581_9PEZI
MPPSATPQQPTSVHAFLRRIAIVQYLFAWILLLAHGIAASAALPALGLIPLTCSALLSGLLLHRDALAAAGSPLQSLSAQNVMMCDLAVGGLQLLLLVFTWIELSGAHYWHSDTSITILGTYGTVFMMVDCGIHFFFALREIFHILTSPRCECPHCRSLHSRGRGAISLPTSEVQEYTPLQSDVDEQAAPNDASEQV